MVGSISGENNFAIATSAKEARHYYTRYIYVTMNPKTYYVLPTGTNMFKFHSGPTDKYPVLAKVTGKNKLGWNTKCLAIDIRPVERAHGALKKKLKSEYKEQLKMYKKVKKQKQRSKKQTKLNVPPRPEKLWHQRMGRKVFLRSDDKRMLWRFKVQVGSGLIERFHWIELDEDINAPGLNPNVDNHILVRDSTNEHIAAYCPNHRGTTSDAKMGTMVFLGEWETLGRDFEITAVVSAMLRIKMVGNPSFDLGYRQPPIVYRSTYRRPMYTYGPQGFTNGT
jgi:hypothetical protein